MKVLITGGAGSIGSNFVHYLKRERPTWQIVVLDLLTYAGNLQNINSLLSEKSVEFVRSDIARSEDLKPVFSAHKFDLVFHFAAESHVDRSNFSADEFVRTNVVGTQNLVGCALEYKVKRFIHVSTDEVYGSIAAPGRFTEKSPLNPTNPYAASKASSDLMVLASVKTNKLDALVTRCTNNYGPYQFPEKLIPLFVTNALEGKKLPLYGDGLNVRSWLFVEDHCQALLLVAEKGATGTVYNIGGATESEVTNVEVTSRILKHLGKSEDLVEKVADRPAHDRRYAIDYGFINKELGWQPTTLFGAGLDRTINWYLANRDWWQEIKTGEYLSFYEKNYGQRPR